MTSFNGLLCRQGERCNYFFVQIYTKYLLFSYLVGVLQCTQEYFITYNITDLFHKQHNKRDKETIDNLFSVMFLENTILLN